MGLLKNLIILVLILLLIWVGLSLVLPFIAWAFELALTLIVLGVLGFAIVYLCRKLRA